MGPPIDWAQLAPQLSYQMAYAEYLLRYGQWWWGQHATHVLGGLAATVATAGLALTWRAMRSRRRRDTWGSARWATRDEIEAAGLCDPGPGIILGRCGPWYARRTLCSADDTHAVVFGPTRSWKTWSLIIPSILNWHGSAVILDIKGELRHWTSGYRQRLGPVYTYHPMGPGSHRINPMALIREETETADAQRLADQLTRDPDARPDQKAEYWRDQVADWLVTIFRYARRHAPFPNTLAGVLGFLRESADRLAALERMIGCDDADVRDGARRLIGMRTTRGRLDEIWDGAIRVLALWRDPHVAASTDALDIPMASIQHGAYPMTIYLQVTAEDLRGRLRLLFRLVLDVLAARLTDRPTQDYQQPLLLVLDEVAALGYMAAVEDICSLAAGFGVRVICAFQSLNQLWAAYGRNTAILDNCAIRLIYAPGNQETAESLSALIGEATVEEVTRRRSGDRLAVMYDASGVQVSSHRRRLMTADELMDMPRHQEVLRVTNTAYGLKPVLLDKIPPYDREFRSKLLPEAA